MRFLKSSFHNHICTLMIKSSENFRCSFKNNFKKTFFPEKSVFLFFLKCFSWHSECSFNDYFKTFCHDSKKKFDERLKSAKKNTKRFFEKTSLNFCIWIIKTFLWQSWRIVPAKRPKLFHLRPENIIFFWQRYSEKLLGKSRKQFRQPCHIRFSRMPRKLSLNIWKM